MDECFGPMKGDRVLVVSLDKVIDGLAPLAEEVKGVLQDWQAKY